MIDVAGRFTLDRQGQRQPGERVVVAGGDSPPRCRPRLEPSELHPEQRGLKVVEPARIAELEVAIAAAVTVMAQAAEPLGQVSAVRQDHAGVTAGAEVL